MEYHFFWIIFTSIIFSAFFSGMEIAFVTSNKLKIELDKKLGFFPAKLLSYFNKNQSKFISAMLVGNNIALVIYGIFMAKALEPKLFMLFESEITVFIAQTIISTILILFTAEFLPKSLFRINPNKLLNFFVLPVSLIYAILFPFVWVVLLFSNLILKYILRINPKDNELSFGLVDIDNYLKTVTGNADNNSDIETEVQIFQNALDFSKVKARECMIPRTELEAIEENGKIEELTQKFIETGYSKILVYKENIDNIIGYVHSYALFENPQNLKQITRPVSLIPESMPANEILELFTKEKKSVAVVVDEFGGTSGIITIEDVIEELFGDIEDEHDLEDSIERQLSETEFIFSARLEIDYLNDKYQLQIPESDEYETLAGYIINIHQSIPQKNEVISTPQFLITTRVVAKNKIEIVHLKRLSKKD